ALARAFEQRAQRLRRVLRDPEINGISAGGANQRAERVPVRRDDLPACAHLTEAVELDEFVAGRENRDARRTNDVHLRESERGEHADLRRAERRARGDRDTALDDILAAR